MKSIPKAQSKHDVFEIFNKLENFHKDGLIINIII